MAEKEIKSVAYSCDPGTMFFQVADESGKVKIIRNAFVEIPDMEDVEEILKQNNWQYIKDNDGYYVIGEDSLRVSRMFEKIQLKRPMQDGVLNKNEDKKMLVLSEMIHSTLGKAPDDKSVVCICISSPSVDGSVGSTYHEARLTGMFTRLGWKVKVIEEGYAVVLSECPTIEEKDGTISKFSGLGLSCGAGRTNCFLAYKALPVIGMSVAKGGDWIDTQVSNEIGMPISQVTSRKEKELDFTNINYDDDFLFAMDAFYTAMIKNVFTHFAKKFVEVKSEIDSPIEIVVAGGTSMPKGFCQKIEKVIKGMQLPFTVKAVKPANDPRNAVVLGCLAQAKVIKNKLLRGETLEDILG